jgi:prepilin-type N-terminal cleavage/methylation domain-containing protein
MSRHDTVPLPFVCDSERGLSLIELLVAIGILGLLVALALPRINSRQLELSTVTQDLVGNLRIARANATARGAHYRATFSSSSYSIQRLQDDDDNGSWEPEGSPLQVDLPNGVSLTVQDGDGVVEFNTRGLIEPNAGDAVAEIERLTLTDSRDGRTRQVEIWPSGQVQEV